MQMGPTGPVVNAFIGVSHARAGALKAAQQVIPTPIAGRALVDTGASGTCVDPSILAALGLQPTGLVAVSTPSTGTTPAMKDQFDVSIWVPAGPNQAQLTVANLPVVSSDLLIPQGLHALIGRDILSRCLLTYDGQNGFFSLAY